MVFQLLDERTQEHEKYGGTPEQPSKKHHVLTLLGEEASGGTLPAEGGAPIRLDE